MKHTCVFCGSLAVFWITYYRPTRTLGLCRKHLDMVEVVAC